jgi:hypothetical protein
LRWEPEAPGPLTRSTQKPRGIPARRCPARGAVRADAPLVGSVTRCRRRIPGYQLLECSSCVEGHPTTTLVGRHSHRRGCPTGPMPLPKSTDHTTRAGSSSPPRRVVSDRPCNAAAVPVAAFTALQGLRHKRQIQPGLKVLINGAAGGVGRFAVQIAREFGADFTGVESQWLLRHGRNTRRSGADRSSGSVCSPRLCGHGS